MARLPRALVALLVLALVPAVAAGASPAASASPAGPTVVRDGDVYALAATDKVVLGNDVVERSWAGAPFGTSAITDKRTGLTAGASPDFRLVLADGVELTGAHFALDAAEATPLERGGVQVRMELSLRAGAAAGAGTGRVVRTVSAFPGVAGFEVRTEVALAGALLGYTLDEVALPGAAPTLHRFAAGYDWRGSDTPDWGPTAAPLGGAHTGRHRETATAPAGQPLEGQAQWLSVEAAGGARAFTVLERVNYASSRGAYDGRSARAAVDLSRDLLYLGPFESDVHLANRERAPVRQRLLRPDRALALEPVFTGLAIDADDEPWQYHRYLEGHRAPAWRREVVFNSNGVDTDRISTGAKDDMDIAEVRRQAAVARRLGVETFILDDGWQAISGDWCPDSPACPEPRHGTSPKFAPRFPDAEFAAVREAIGDMNLGLWMSPMHFHPESAAYKANPQWACAPVGSGMAVANMVERESGSWEAGMGTWNPEATGPQGTLVDHIEGRIRRAITAWGVRYFKFDFLVWLDCAGADPVTLYDYRESFVRMLDRVQADHPDVTLQVDETNDYRLFPFESVSRGPSWFANGNPKANEALHNLWNLAPYVPGYTIGQSALAGERDRRSTDYLMAVALGSHLTFFSDLTRLTDEQVATAGEWTALYRADRDRFAAFTYPLLDDPLPGTTWTALQPWDADRQRGALLVYRQDHPDATRTVALRGVRGEGAYRLTDARTGAVVAEHTAEELRAGVPITLPERFSAAVLLVDRLPQ